MRRRSMFLRKFFLQFFIIPWKCALCLRQFHWPMRNLEIFLKIENLHNELSFCLIQSNWTLTAVGTFFFECLTRYAMNSRMKNEFPDERSIACINWEKERMNKKKAHHEWNMGELMIIRGWNPQRRMTGDEHATCTVYTRRAPGRASRQMLRWRRDEIRRSVAAPHKRPRRGASIMQNASTNSYNWRPYGSCTPQCVTNGAPHYVTGVVSLSIFQGTWWKCMESAFKLLKITL